MEIKNVRVRQMENESYSTVEGRTVSRPVANQFTIETDEGEYFQSYQTIIAFRPRYRGNEIEKPEAILDTRAWDYSKTTGKYRNLFLGDDGIAETRRKIKEGVYVLADLNG